MQQAIATSRRSSFTLLTSGWDVDVAGTRSDTLQPEVLISIVVPKLCARNFRGRHLVAGRFLPPDLVKKYELNLAPFDACSWTSDVTQVASPNSSGSDDRIDQSAASRKADEGSDNSH